MRAIRDWEPTFHGFAADGSILPLDRSQRRQRLVVCESFYLSSEPICRVTQLCAQQTLGFVEDLDRGEVTRGQQRIESRHYIA